MNKPTSSPSSKSSYTYDVFISFRGPDTRRRFIGYLYPKLCEIKEAKIFMDEPTIEPGDLISETLIKAIQKSRIGLVVFSPNYASSTHCLDELAKIIDLSIDQKHMLFLPIFYEVQPSILHKKNESYEEALTTHEIEAKVSQKKINEWREALKKAAGVSGFTSNKYRFDSELIGEIAKCITKKISKLREGDKNQIIYNIDDEKIAPQDRFPPALSWQIDFKDKKDKASFSTSTILPKEPKPQSSRFNYGGEERLPGNNKDKKDKASVSTSTIVPKEPKPQLSRFNYGGEERLPGNNKDKNDKASVSTSTIVPKQPKAQTTTLNKNREVIHVPSRSHYNEDTKDKALVSANTSVPTNKIVENKTYTYKGDFGTLKVSLNDAIKDHVKIRNISSPTQSAVEGVINNLKFKVSMG